MSFFRPVYVAKAKRTPRRPNAKQVKFEDKLTVDMHSNVRSALDALKNVTTEKKVQALYEAGKAKDIPKLFTDEKVAGFFDNVGGMLEDAVKGGSKLAVQALRPGAANQAQLGITNDAIAEYVSIRTGALIKDVPETMQAVVQDCVRVGLANGQTPRDIASAIMDGVGLDANRARAVASYQGSDKEAFAESMTDARAMAIARTEISFAVNHGQVETWKDAVDDGMMGADSQKVWITDPNPCPKICALMDGVQIPLDEDFILPSGEEVVAPPAHPNCRCQTGILEEGGVKPTSGRERDDGGSVDDERDQSDA